MDYNRGQLQEISLVRDARQRRVLEQLKRRELLAALDRFGLQATNCLAPGRGYALDDSGQRRASQAFLARRPIGRRRAGRRVELEVGDRVRTVGPGEI